MTDTSTPAVELKACPFCGETPTVHEHEHPNSSGLNYWVVYCQCGASVEETYRAEAIAAWNTRAPAEGRDMGEDWFAGDVDCDGNELVTIRADELQRLKDEREKFMWQVRDTCVRAEKAEAALSRPAPSGGYGEAIERCARKVLRMNLADLSLPEIPKYIAHELRALNKGRE